MNIVDHLESYQRANPARYFAYRGQPREYLNLVPSFARHLTVSSYGAAELIEQELIAAFRRQYAQLKDQMADMPTPEQIRSGYDLRCLSVMQHYEVPTRLLDWTNSFWTAMYFACSSDFDGNGEIWLYDRSIFRPQLEKRIELKSLLERVPTPTVEPPMLTTWRGWSLVAELDPDLTPRIREQSAHHTVSATVSADHAPLISYLADEAKKLADDAFYFRRLVVPQEMKRNMLIYLANYRNITASTVFPDVVSLGRFLRWQLESLRNTLM